MFACPTLRESPRSGRFVKRPYDSVCCITSLAERGKANRERGA